MSRVILKHLKSTTSNRVTNVLLLKGALGNCEMLFIQREEEAMKATENSVR